MKSLTKFFSTTLWMSAGILFLSVGLFLVSCESTGSDDPPVTDASVSLSVAVGETGSVVSVANSISFSYSLYTSSEDNCDLDNYTTCANVELNSISAGTTANLSNLTKATTGDYYFYLVNANNVSVKKTLSPLIFKERAYHEVALLDDTMYLIGGLALVGNTLNLEPKNDVWSSTDGETWTQITPDAGIPGRSYHQVAVLGSTMYLIGGWDENYVSQNDVWSSTDGANWTQVTTAPTIFSARYGHQVAVLGNTMYLIGGYDDTTKFNDVWSSTDGANWTEEVANGNAPFSERYYHQVVEVNGTMYLIGGNDGANNNLNDVWSSRDGATWTRVTTTPTIFSERAGHQVVVLDGTMYLIGGAVGTSRQNDVWSSTDGANWTEVTANANFSARYDHQVAVLGNTMYLIAGDVGRTKNDVWSSTDGATWTLLPHTYPLSFDY